MSEKTTIVLETDLLHWHAWKDTFYRSPAWKVKAAQYRDGILVVAQKELTTHPPTLEVTVQCWEPQGRVLYTELLRAIGAAYPEAAHLLTPEPARSYRRNEPPTRNAPLAEWFDWYHGVNDQAGRQVVTLADVAQGVDRGLSTVKRAHAVWTKEPR